MGSVIRSAVISRATCNRPPARNNAKIHGHENTIAELSFVLTARREQARTDPKG